MLPYVVLGILLGLPLVLGLFFRVSASYIFFSVMAGELLARYFKADATHVIQSSLNNPSAAHYGELLLLVAPVILTSIFLKGSISRGKSFLHVIPLVITGVVFAVFALPLLPLDVQAEIRATYFGGQLFEISNMVVGAVVGIQLVALWLLNRGEGGKKHRRK